MFLRLRCGWGPFGETPLLADQKESLPRWPPIRPKGRKDDYGSEEGIRVGNR